MSLLAIVLRRVKAFLALARFLTWRKWRILRRQFLTSLTQVLRFNAMTLCQLIKAIDDFNSKFGIGGVSDIFFLYSGIIHVQATWLVNPSTLIVDQKWHWQVVVKLNRAIKLNIQAIFRGGLLCSHSFGGEILLYSHSSGGKSHYIAILPGGNPTIQPFFRGGKLAMGEK